MPLSLLTSDHRVPFVLFHSLGVHLGYDIFYRPKIWTIIPSCLYLDLLSRRFGIRHGYQGLRRGSETNVWRK